MRYAALGWLVAGAFAVVGCSSTPMSKTETDATPVATSAADEPAQPAMTQKDTSMSEPVRQARGRTVPLYLDPASDIANKRQIYFDFDEFTVKSEYASLLELHGKYLASNPALKIKIEGNSDERGGAEYNLALGQKRAEAVVTALKIYGVQSGQVEATSWGEEKPMNTAHDETAWSQNRRADIVYPQQ